MDDRELGRRIGYWRRRRNLTQAVFADRLGRSKSWVEKVERGQRSAGRLSVLDEICEVLQIGISALIGEEPHRSSRACLDDSEVDRIRSALERYAFDTPNPGAPGVASLRRRLAHAWAAFEFADYQVMGSLLPDLLEDAQRAHAVLGSDESGILLSEVYQVIASTLRKLGEHTLAGRLEPECRSEELRALYGHVLLQGAMAAAASGDDRRVGEMITEAHQAAQFVGAGSNHFRLAFGPVNVALHQVAALVALGENGRALAAADAISSEGLRMLRKERRAALMIDTARACSHAGNRDEALRRLLEAEEIAAPEVRCRPVAQATIADLLHRWPGSPPLELARLAARAGVRP